MSHGPDYFIEWETQWIRCKDTGVVVATIDDQERLDELQYLFGKGWWIGVYVLQDEVWGEEIQLIIDGCSSREYRMTVCGREQEVFYLLAARPDYWTACIDNLTPTMKPGDPPYLD